jgi:hypothetical protein
LLAKKVEQVASVLVDRRVDMGRWPSLLRDMEGCGRLPSEHELEVYGFAGVVEGGEKEGILGNGREWWIGV